MKIIVPTLLVVPGCAVPVGDCEAAFPALTPPTIPRIKPSAMRVSMTFRCLVEKPKCMFFCVLLMLSTRRERRPSVARVRGENPMLVRIEVAVKSPTLRGSLIVASWVEPPRTRAREKTIRKYHPADLLKPCL